MIVDVNVLVYAVDSRSPHQRLCQQWLEAAFTGHGRVGFSWATQLAFLRLTTHPRIVASPLKFKDAWELLDRWLDEPLAWTPTETPNHGRILRDLTDRYELTGNLIPDAHLAALAIGHGVPVVSCDSDFARFTEVDWINPNRPRP